jgi:hypothetical protein
MSNTKTIMGQASNQYVAPTDSSDLFSTYLYTGTGASKTITNGLDLGGEGGLVWIKKRNESTNSDHMLFDTERGTNERLFSNDRGRSYTRTDQLNSFDSSGFTLGGDSPASPNTSGKEYVSWSFRKAPKFFDVVTYTGNSTAGRTVSHNLGVTPGMIIVKRTDATATWYVYHRGLPTPATKMLQLNNTEGAITGFWNGTAPTSTEFSVGDSNSINQTNGTFVAYLFAHNDGDGEFGPDSDQDIIKCGSYTGNSSETNGPNINLGFEPQWVMIKRSDTSDGWPMIDSMRGFTADNNVEQLSANNTDGDTARTKRARPTATGFQVNSSDNEWNENNGNYIYMAIRRGPLAPPEAATEVFAAVTRNSSVGGVNYYTGFPVDLSIYNARTAPGNYFHARLTSADRLQSINTAAEISGDVVEFQSNVGYQPGTSSTTTNALTWNWKRAPGFMDVVCYTGDGTSNQTFKHNLTVKPDMVWIKNRGRVQDWWVGLDDSIVNLDGSLNSSDDFGYNVIGTFTDATVQTLNQNQQATNYNGDTYIAYLFATLDGVSKVGSVSHSNTTNVDCGFSNGARFVLLKRYDAAGDWYVWDSVRGIIAGNDPYLLLNSTAAAVTNTDFIDPLNAGFTISDAFTDGDYIFYAIA